MKKCENCKYWSRGFLSIYGTCKKHNLKTKSLERCDLFKGTKSYLRFQKHWEETREEREEELRKEHVAKRKAGIR